MSNTFLRSALLSVALTVSNAAWADMFEPSHSCWKPTKPFEFTDEWEVRRFYDEVREYKECIADFVEEQQEAMNTHQAAAESAIDEWNDFVNFELN